MLTITLHRTQLDVVAGAPQHGKAQGELLLNGVPRAQTPFKEMSCYVMQRDVLLESATVSAAAAMAAMHLSVPPAGSTLEADLQQPQYMSATPYQPALTP